MGFKLQIFLMLLNVSFESRFQQEKVSEKSAEKGDVSFQRTKIEFSFFTADIDFLTLVSALEGWKRY